MGRVASTVFLSRRALLLVSCAVSAVGFVAFRESIASLRGEGFAHYPFWDDWDTPLSFLQDLEAGWGEALQSLFSQHNESRQVTTKLLAVMIDRFGVFYSDMTIHLSYVVRVATIALICLPFFLRVVRGPLDWLLRLTVVIFSVWLYAVGPANLVNGLWYAQIGLFLGLFFVMGSLSLQVLALEWERAGGMRRRRVMASSALAGVLGLLAIFSFSGNILLLPCAMLVAWLMAPSRDLRASLGFLAKPPVLIILVSLSASIVLFFWGYESPPHHAGLRAQALSLAYVVNFLANFYSQSSDAVFWGSRIWIATVLFALIGFLLVRAVGLWRGCLPWPVVHSLGQSCFLLGLAILSALGRGGDPMGADYALSSRYNSISLLFASLTSVFLVQLLDEIRLRRGDGSVGFRLSPAAHWGSGLILSILALLVSTGLIANERWQASIHQMYASRRLSRECLRRVVRSGVERSDASMIECAERLYPDPERLSDRFSGSWCRPPQFLPSSTIRRLCEDLADASRPRRP